MVQDEEIFIREELGLQNPSYLDHLKRKVNNTL
jgi:hypothetical protein